MNVSRHRHAFVAIALTAGVGLLVGTLEWARRNPAITLPPAATPATRPGFLQIADAVRSLKLVTWQFETTISAETVSDKWYGDAVASVRAPVRYQYGVDLSQLKREDFVFGEEGYTFIIAPPERISVEVDVAKLEQTLEVSGARWKSRNQDQVDAARKRLAAVARDSQLSPADVTRLRDASREQIELVLKRVLFGNEAVPTRVTVRFAQ